MLGKSHYLILSSLQLASYYDNIKVNLIPESYGPNIIIIIITICKYVNQHPGHTIGTI